MKYISLSVILFLLAATSHAQTDTLKKIKGKNVALTKTKPLNMTSLDLKLSQTEKKLREIESLVAQIKNEMDSQSEISGETSLKLQSYLDRYTQFMEILSNIMKKSQETKNSIIQNIK